MRIPPVAAELFHADRRTDRHDEANCRFRNFSNAPKYDACPLELSHLGHKTGGDARVLQEAKRLSLARQTPLLLQILVIASP